MLGICCDDCLSPLVNAGGQAMEAETLTAKVRADSAGFPLAINARVDFFPTKESAAAAAIKAGWQHHGDGCWQCPSCARSN